MGGDQKVMQGGLQSFIYQLLGRVASCGRVGGLISCTNDHQSSIPHIAEPYEEGRFLALLQLASLVGPSTGRRVSKAQMAEHRARIERML